MDRRHSLAALLCLLGSHSLWGVSSAPRLPRWPTWEIALLAVLFVLALRSRVWNLTNFPDNIHPDEIMTGHRRHSELSKSNNSAIVGL